MTCQKVVKSH